MGDREVEVVDKRGTKNCPNLCANINLRQGKNLENVSLSIMEAKEIRAGLNKLLGE